MPILEFLLIIIFQMFGGGFGGFGGFGGMQGEPEPETKKEVDTT